MSLATEIVADSPVCYWKLDEAVGAATVADSSGNSHTGTPAASVHLGGLGLGNAAPGCAWSDNATGDESIASAAHADFDVDDTFTLEVCYRVLRDFTSGTRNPIIGIVDSGETGGPVLVEVTSGASRKIVLTDRSDRNTIVLDSTGTITDTHLYHHVIVTKTGATAKMYLDGDDVTGDYAAATFSTTSSYLLKVKPGWFDRGQVCHAAVYNTALSAARVAAHYAAFQTDNTPTLSQVIFGLHADSIYKGTDAEIDSQIATCDSVYATLARSTLRWDIVEASDGGGYDWDRHDEYVRICNVYGVTPLFVFAGSPTWANGGADRWDVPGVGADATFQAFTADCVTFITDFVARYKPGGSGPYTIPDPFWIELWNEPNLTGFWSNTSANTDQEWADQYAYWYVQVRAAVLAEYASARCIMAGLSSWGAVGAADQNGEEFLRKVIGSAQWTGTDIDYAGYHPYSANNDPDDVTSFDNHLNDSIACRDVFAELGYEVPLCLTELGFSDATSEADQATKLTTALNRITDEWSPFVPMLVWWPIADDVGADYGIFNTTPADGSVSTDTKVAAASFSTLAQSEQQQYGPQLLFTAGTAVFV